MGLAHHRPLKRHIDVVDVAPAAGVAAGRGQHSSTAATMAASTAGSGSGRTEATTGAAGSVFTDGPTQSGTLPCLRLGSSSRLDMSTRSARTNTRRVSVGSMTSST